MIEEVVAKLSTTEQVLMFVAGVLFVATQWLAGRKATATWYVGLVGNAVWYAVVVVGQNWALLLLVVAMTWVNTKNLLAWRREARQRALPAELNPERVLARLTRGTRDPEDVAAVLAGLLSQAATGPACGECDHAASAHGPHGGCGTITETGRPCDCGADSLHPPEETP